MKSLVIRTRAKEYYYRDGSSPARAICPSPLRAILPGGFLVRLFTQRTALLLVGLVLAAGCSKRDAANLSSDGSDAQSKSESRPVVPNLKGDAVVVLDSQGHPFLINPNVPIMPPLTPAAQRSLREKRQPIDDKYPLPQDAAKATKLRNERLAAYRKMTVDVFDQTAAAKAPWADVARKAMEAYCLRVARPQLTICGVEHQNFLDAVKATMETKCDDPLIRYWQVRFAKQDDPDHAWDQVPPAETAEGFRTVVEQLPKNPYPPVIRIHIAWNAYTHLDHIHKNAPNIVQKEEVDAAMKLFWQVYEELAGMPDPISQHEVFVLAERVGFDHELRKESRIAAWQKVDKILEKPKHQSGCG